MHAYFSSAFNSRQILISKQIKQMKSEGPDIFCPLVIYTQGGGAPSSPPGIDAYASAALYWIYYRFHYER